MKITSIIVALTISASVSFGKSAVAPGGPNGAVQFNNAGNFGGDSNLTWNGTFLNVGSSSSGYLTTGAAGQSNSQPFALFSANRNALYVNPDGSVTMGLVDGTSTVSGSDTVKIVGNSTFAPTLFRIFDQKNPVNVQNQLFDRFHVTEDQVIIGNKYATGVDGGALSVEGWAGAANTVADIEANGDLLGLIPNATSATEVNLIRVRDSGETGNEAFRVYMVNDGGPSYHAAFNNLAELNMYNSPINMNNSPIRNVSEPTSAQDAATKNYVDTHSPSGTLCGYYDVTGSSLIVSCQGQDPSVSCPAGYTQKTSSSAKFCAAN